MKSSLPKDNRLTIVEGQEGLSASAGLPAPDRMEAREVQRLLGR